MANRTIAQVLKMHDEAVKSIEAQLESAGRPKPVAHDFFLKQKEERLNAMKTRLLEAQKDREAAIARIDRNISTLSGNIRNFEKEIEADRKNLEAPPAPERPERPAGSSIREIRGIGEVFEARLKENGITKVSEVANLEQARLAAMLGISGERAAELIKAAKRLR